jgi:hypothetical protein
LASCSKTFLQLLYKLTISLKVDEDATEAGKSAWVEFKRIVWHASFEELLRSIQKHTHAGVWIKCGDDVERHLFPIILMLSADYEEQ